MFSLIILCLATWRLSVLIMDDEGPYGVLERMRHVFGIRYNEYSQRYGLNTWAQGLLCTYCNTVWIGLILAIVYLISPPVAVAIGLPFALSAFAIIVGKVVDKI